MDAYSTVVDDLGALPPRFRLDPDPDPGSPTLADLIAASMLVQRTPMILAGSALAAAFLTSSLSLADPERIHVSPGTPAL